MRRNRSRLSILAVAAGCLVPTLSCGDEGEGEGGVRANVRGESGSGARSGDAGAGGDGAGGSGTANAAGSSAAPGGGGAGACDSLSELVLAEELPDPNASLAGVVFDGDVAGFVDAALERRYPFGLELVRGARMETAFGDCSVLFANEAASAADVYELLEVIVHECGHVYNAFLSSGNRDAYEVSPELSFRCERGDTTSRGGDTFARSRITGDAYQRLRPACAGSSRPGCDPYAPVYLNGNPDDATFDSGDQGFNLLMEEAVQYVNSIATAWAFVDQQSPTVSVSARDGILTFLWYIERYLRMARTEFPGAYARISGDDCWRDLTLGVWARGQRLLELTRNERGLGIEDDVLERLVEDSELLEEIDRLRELDDCP